LKKKGRKDRGNACIGSYLLASSLSIGKGKRTGKKQPIEKREKQEEEPGGVC
jgi:hypothetical protein